MQPLKIDTVFSNNKETNHEKTQIHDDFIIYYNIL